jgi:hypothetical protein
MLSDFSCFLPGESIPSLCFYNSTCDAENNICICEPGYIHDFTLFHNPNCGLPVIFFPIMAGIFSTLWAITTIALLFKCSRRKITRKSQILLGLLSISNIGCIITESIQQGCFEGTAVAVLGWFLMADMLLSMYSFLNIFNSDRIIEIKSVIIKTGFTVALIQSVTGIVYMVYCRTDNADIIFIAINVELASSGTVLMIQLVVYTTEFIKLLQEKSERPEYQALLVRMKVMNTNLKRIAIISPTTVPLQVLCRDLLGSVPFQWVLLVLMFSTLLYLPNIFIDIYPVAKGTETSVRDQSSSAVVVVTPQLDQ